MPSIKFLCAPIVFLLNKLFSFCESFQNSCPSINFSTQALFHLWFKYSPINLLMLPPAGGKEINYPLGPICAKMAALGSGAVSLYRKYLAMNDLRSGRDGVR